MTSYIHANMMSGMSYLHSIVMLVLHEDTYTLFYIKILLAISKDSHTRRDGPLFSDCLNSLV